MSVKLIPGIHAQTLCEYNGPLSGWSHSIDGSVWKDCVKVFPSESERLEATKDMTPEEVDAYYKHLQEEQLKLIGKE